MMIFAMGVLAAVGALRAADQKPDFNGTWKLNLAKSDFTQVAPPDSRTDVIEQSGDKFKISTRLHAGGNDDQFSVAFTANGQEVTIPPNTPASKVGRYTILQKIKAEWNGASLVVLMYTKGKESVGVFETVYTLSPDGKTLTASSHVKAVEGDLDATMKSVYDKQ